MNWADMSTLMTVLANAFVGPVAARSQGAPWWMIGASLIFGLFFGLACGLGSSKLAYRMLDTAATGVRAGVLMFFYTFAPMVIMLLSSILCGMACAGVTTLIT